MYPLCIFHFSAYPQHFEQSTLVTTMQECKGQSENWIHIQRFHNNCYPSLTFHGNETVTFTAFGKYFLRFWWVSCHSYFTVVVELPLIENCVESKYGQVLFPWLHSFGHIEDALEGSEQLDGAVRPNPRQRAACCSTTYSLLSYVIWSNVQFHKFANWFDFVPPFRHHCRCVPVA